MHDADGVEVTHGLENALHHGSSLLFLETALLANFAEELAAGAVLHHKVEEALVLVRFEEVYDVGVVHLLQNLHFAH